MKNIEVGKSRSQLIELESVLKSVEQQLKEKNKELLYLDLLDKLNSNEYQLSQIEITDEEFYQTEKLKKYSLTIRASQDISGQL